MIILLLLRSIGGSLGRLAYFLGVRREVTISNLRLAYPELSDRARHRTAVRCYSMLGQVFLEFLYLRFASRSVIGTGLQINNIEKVAPWLSNPKGCILLSGHIANWEWLAIGCGLNVRPINVIVKAQRSSFAERFLNAMRTRFGNRMIDVTEARRIFRSLANGEPIALLGDQSSFAETVRVPFFGTEVPTFEGAAKIALRTGAPLLFLQPVKKTWRGYECTFHHVPSDDLPDSSPENVRILTARHTALLEQVIREKPEFWLWQHRRWKYID